MTYNPYDLLSLRINGKPIDGRPFAFDSDVADQLKMTNAAGVYVKPVKVTTVCPDCGQGLIFDVSLGDPPFPVIERVCEYCHPVPPPMADPFVNPLAERIIPVADLDPLARDVAAPLSVKQSTVAERLRLSGEHDLVPERVQDDKPLLTEKPLIETVLGQADDMGEEQDIEDDVVE